MFWRKMGLAVDDDWSYGRNAFFKEFSSRGKIYLAMLSRGYEGTMPGNTAGRFGLGEMLFLSLTPMLLFLRIYIG